MISPRYPASMVPGVLRTVMPCFSARPERGCTKPTKPFGSAIETPVGTKTLERAGIVVAIVDLRSAPASPGLAYTGSKPSAAVIRTGSSLISRQRNLETVSDSKLSPQTLFRERVTPNLGTFLAITALIPAITLVSEPFDFRIGLIAGTLIVLGVWAALYAFAPIIEVTESEFAAGRATIERKHISGIEVIGKDRIFHERGPGLRPDAYRLFQGTVHQALKVEINDPLDPTPYWIISTRRPEKLKQALETGD